MHLHSDKMIDDRIGHPQTLPCQAKPVIAPFQQAFRDALLHCMAVCRVADEFVTGRLHHPPLDPIGKAQSKDECLA